MRLQPHHRHQLGIWCMGNKFTVWVGNEHRAKIRIVVRDASNVNAAMQEALERAAQSWACDPETLNINGIAEGDITELDPDGTSG
jgi:hypothetical protein